MDRSVVFNSSRSGMQIKRGKEASLVALEWIHSWPYLHIYLLWSRAFFERSSTFLFFQKCQIQTYICNNLASRKFDIWNIILELELFRRGNKIRRDRMRKSWTISCFEVGWGCVSASLILMIPLDLRNCIERGMYVLPTLFLYEVIDSILRLCRPSPHQQLDRNYAVCFVYCKYCTQWQITSFCQFFQLW